MSKVGYVICFERTGTGAFVGVRGRIRAAEWSTRQTSLSTVSFDALACCGKKSDSTEAFSFISPSNFSLLFVYTRFTWEPLDP